MSTAFAAQIQRPRGFQGQRERNQPQVAPVPEAEVLPVVGAGSGGTTSGRISQANGFALALERHVSSGGGMRKGGRSRRAGFRFTEGKLRGLTLEQATVQARQMWAKAPDHVRDAYANSARVGLLAPSERRMAAQIERPGTPPPATPIIDPSTESVEDFADRIGIRATIEKPIPRSAGGAESKAAKPAQATPQENGRALEIAREAAGQYGQSADNFSTMREIRAILDPNRPQNVELIDRLRRDGVLGVKAVPTDRPANPGLVPPSEPNAGAPSRSTLISGTPSRGPRLGGIPTNDAIHYGSKPAGEGWILVGMKDGQEKWSRGKDTAAAEYSARAATARNVEALHPPSMSEFRQSSTGYAGPRPGRYEPDLSHIPSAVPVAEAPMTQAEYDQAGSAIKQTLEPGSPEMSAALGRRRQFEDEQMKAKAAAMRRERLGPSFAERDAADRNARRALDRRVMGSYGRVS